MSTSQDTEISQARSKRLKSSTSSAHTLLDNRIMAADPFGTNARYLNFLRVQHAFHQEIDALYGNARLANMLPDLAGRRRLDAIAQDLADIGGTSDLGSAEPQFRVGEAHDIPAALGWLYVAEGSNLGAAFLLKAAQKLGLSETFGARHLAGAPEGRGLHWRTFTAALDSVSLTAEDEERVVAGAIAAFTRVRELVEQAMPPVAKQDVA